MLTLSISPENSNPKFPAKPQENNIVPNWLKCRVDPRRAQLKVKQRNGKRGHTMCKSIAPVLWQMRVQQGTCPPHNKIQVVDELYKEAQSVREAIEARTERPLELQAGHDGRGIDRDDHQDSKPYAHELLVSANPKNVSLTMPWTKIQMWSSFRSQRAALLPTSSRSETTGRRAAAQATLETNGLTFSPWMSFLPCLQTEHSSTNGPLITITKTSESSITPKTAGCGLTIWAQNGDQHVRNRTATDRCCDCILALWVCKYVKTFSKYDAGGAHLHFTGACKLTLRICPIWCRQRQRRLL